VFPLSKLYAVILNKLPATCPPALLDLLAEKLGTSEIPELPALLGEKMGEELARELQTEIELFGGSVELLGEEGETAIIPGLEELSLELDREIEQLKIETAPPAPISTRETTPEYSLKFDDEETKAAEITELGFGELEFSLKDEPKLETPPAPPKKEEVFSGLSFAEPEEELPQVAKPKVVEPPVTTSSLELSDLTLHEVEEPALAPPPERAPVKEVPKEPVKEVVPQVVLEISAPAVESVPTEAPIKKVKKPKKEPEPEEVYDLDEEEEDEDEEVETAPVDRPFYKRPLLIAPILVCALLASVFMLINKEPPAEKTSGPDIVQVLLAEQDRLVMEERINELKSKVVSKTRLAIIERFSLDVLVPPLSGRIKIGKTTDGYAIEEFKLAETERQRLSPQDLAAGKVPRPWIKRIELPAKQSEASEKISHSGEAFAFIEDDVGTLRIPLELRFSCELSDESAATCSLKTWNKGQPQPLSEFQIERNENLGFLMNFEGLFEGTLRKEKL